MAENNGKNQEQIRQKIILVNKDRLDLQGVLKVDDFDNEKIFLKTVLGDFEITGNNLHIDQLLLDEEKMSVCGDIISLSFVSEGETRTAKKRNLAFFDRLKK